MKDIISRHKAGEHIGICSVCSAHPLVIEAALRFDLHTNNKVLIEATSNQVNQFGGYTGMQPAELTVTIPTSVAIHIGSIGLMPTVGATITASIAGYKPAQPF